MNTVRQKKYTASGLPVGSRVLMLSTDSKIFEENSEVRQRLIGYGRQLAVLHIIIYTRRNSGYQSAEIAPNVFVHPTNCSKLFYFWKGYKIGKKIIGNCPAAPSLVLNGEGGIPQKLEKLSAEDGSASSGKIENCFITCQDPFETGWLGWLLKQRFEKIVLQIQIHTDFLSPYSQRESFKNKLRAICAKLLLKKADNLRVVSRRIYNALATYGLTRPGQEIILAPVLISATSAKSAGNELKEKYKHYDQIVLMAGRFTKEKNIGLAIRAMSEIIKTRPKTLLLLVGAGPEEKNIKYQISNIKINDNVIIEPWTESIQSYYALADIYLLTSNYEGYSRTVIEAMTAGLPVVMTNVGIAGEVIIDGVNGLIIPVNDVQSLTECLYKLLNDVKYSQSLGAAAKNSVSQFIKTTSQNTETQLLSVVLKKKLCYIMPDYQRHDATHFSYLSGFIRKISDHFDIVLVIEKGIRPSDNFGCRRVLSPWFNSSVLRGAELFIKFLYLRLLGYRDFYVHYSFLAALCAKLAGGRVFYWNCGEPWKYRRSWTREFFERLVYRKIDYLVTGTAGLAGQYAQYYGLNLSKVKIMPNWIDLEKIKNPRLRISASRFAQATSFGGQEKSPLKADPPPAEKIKIDELKKQLNIKNEKIILFVHRLSKRKGAHYLPGIIKTLIDTNKNANDANSFVMLIIGSGPERENIQLQITNYQLQNKVRFLGSISNSQLPDYYLLADIFIMPSDEEGFPHVLLEAMSAGAPFVASDVGGVREIAPKIMYNYLIKSGTTGDFCSAVNKLLRLPPPELKRLKQELRLWVERYDLPVVIGRFVDLFR